MISSVRWPESNCVERWHRSIKRILNVCRDCIQLEEKSTLCIIGLTERSARINWVQACRISTWKELKNPEILLFEKWANEEEENLVIEYVFDLVNRMKHYQDLAKERRSILEIKETLV